MSEEKTLVQKMAEVMIEIGYVQKDGKLDAFPFYTFASSEKVFEKAREALGERGIAVHGDCDLVHTEIITTEKSVRHLVLIKHTLTFTDGTDSLSVSAIGEGMDTGDKAAQKANTVGVKYCLAKAHLLSWGDDPEADPSIDDDKLTDWLEEAKKLEQESTATVKAWWPQFKAQVIEDCGEGSAARVYKAFQGVLNRKLKADKAAGDASP